MTQEKQRPEVKTMQGLVRLGQSKRLAAMRDAQEQQLNKTLAQRQKSRNNDEKNQLQQARYVVTQTIAKLKATYPQGMQNRLFALRYGSEEKINQMPLKKVFKLLGIKKALAKELTEVKYKDE